MAAISYDRFIYLHLERMGFHQLEETCILPTYNVKLVGCSGQTGYNVEKDILNPKIKVFKVTEDVPPESSSLDSAFSRASRTALVPFLRFRAATSEASKLSGSASLVSAHRDCRQTQTTSKSSWMQHAPQDVMSITHVSLMPPSHA